MNRARAGFASMLLLLAACASSAPLGVSHGTHEAPSSASPPDRAAPPRTSRCHAEVVDEHEPSSGLIETLAPYRIWPVLGAREQGLLLPSRTRWGVQAAWTPIMGQLIFSQGLDGYAFTSRGANPWLLYFESSGEGDNFLRNWQRPLADGTIGRFDAASFRPTTPNRWGLSRMAHIVEVEVNRGRGAGSELHFVATDVRVLDRTPELPIDPVRALDEARDCFDDFVSSARPSLGAALERAGAGESFDPSWEPEREERIEALSPTFDPDTRRLRVVFALRVLRIRTRRERRMFAPSCPPGAPCMPPHEEVEVTTRGYGADLAQEIEFEGDGRRAVVRDHGPVALDPQVLVRARLVHGTRTE